MINETRFTKKSARLSIAVRLAFVFVLLVVTLLAGGSFGPTAFANPLVIDDFGVNQGPLILTATGDIGTTIASTASGGMLGGERDVRLHLVGGASGLRVTATTWGGQHSHSQESTITAWSEAIWDGSGDDASTIQPTGLGGVDLTESGAQDAFELAIVSADLNATIVITVYTDADNYSTATHSFGAISTPEDVMFPYAVFAQGTGATGPADFTDVGAIVLGIDGSAVVGLDVTIDTFETTAMVTAEKTVTDLNGGVVMPGDVLEFEVTIENFQDEAGLDALGIGFSDTVDSNFDLDCASPGDPSTTRGTVTSCTGGLGGNFSVSVGTIPDNTTVTITFQVTVNPALPGTVTEICNQGWVTSAGGLNIPTDDPGEPGDEDPTCVDLYLDFGDAPESGTSFPTLLASNGAVHFQGGVYMGACADAEADGQPNGSATGDDNNTGSPVFGSCSPPGDDEDGVSFPGLVIAGTTANVAVTVTGGTCDLSAWIDFYLNDDWDDAGEQIFSGQPLGAGVNNLSFSVPLVTQEGTAIARFRCTNDGAVGYGGTASDGEVEDHEVDIVIAADFGDAPDPGYPTLSASNGASHRLGGSVWLGTCVGGELDGQQSVGATGDDNDTSVLVNGSCTVNSDDEDGVTFPNPLYIGTSVAVDIVASAPCVLNAWMDFNGSNGWADPGEQIFTNQSLVAGTNNLNFTIPQGATAGNTYARFRCTTATGVSYTGQAADGETEDYYVNLEYAVDWGDAPESPPPNNYPTLNASNGASHLLGSNNVYLGDCVDAEADGQPSVGAVDDDNNVGSPVFGTCATPGDDADGVTFPNPLYVGATGDVRVDANAACTLYAWIDFNHDGDWADPGEDLFPGGQSLNPNVNNLTFSIPSDALIGDAYGRFRCTTGGAVSYDGQASDGEVEDYYGDTLTIEYAYDYGDAPPAYNLTMLSDPSYAEHRLGGGVYLGACVDGEDDGHESTNADGDDNDNGSPDFGTCTGNDDEDGVDFTDTLFTGETVNVDVYASAACDLSAWIDFNGDDDWDDAGEKIFNGASLSAGNNTLSFSVPLIGAGSVEGTTYARFRCGPDGGGGVSYDGTLLTGEVEDYEVEIVIPRDWGDAPDSYKTLLASNGPRHQLGGNVYLGACVDAEANGQPSTGAVDDDNDDSNLDYGTCTGNDDEDGVTFESRLLIGDATAQVTVTANVACDLSAWMDFNIDGDWDDAGEKIFTDVTLTGGGVNNVLSFAIPPSATPGETYARFRCVGVGTGPIGYDGESDDGEVEDYGGPEVELRVAEDFGDAPDGPYPSLLASNGARHILTETVYLGACVDGEFDSPVPTSDDDTDSGTPTYGTCGTPNDDEDGVTFPSTLYIGATGQVNVTVGGTGIDGCYLSAWIDFNNNGNWNDAGDRIFTDQHVNPGANPLTFPIPQGATVGLRQARFRCSTATGLLYTGQAPDGEVEDYDDVEIEQASDWGDAPDTPYPTLGVAEHLLGTNNVYLGACVDAELNGLQSPNADGDDNDDGSPDFGTCVGNDDEDGVTFPNPLYVGATGDVSVFVNNVSNLLGCTLSAWIDFNHDGDWGDPGENLFPGGQALNPGTNNLTFAIPSDAQIGDAYGRFRCTTAGPVNDSQQASDGEVEDYYGDTLTIVYAYDFGDAQGANYPTTLAQNGARHRIGVGAGNVYLGHCVDREDDGLASANADGDDNNTGSPVFGTCAQAGDDEDGVRFPTTLYVGDGSVDVEVYANAACNLYAWIDFNGDGDWVDAGEKIIDGTMLTGGITDTLNFAIPLWPDAVAGDTFARFRCSNDAAAASLTGEATDGDVEDHPVTIEYAYDFSDEPDPTYPTLLASNGARHRLGTNVYLGACVDAESNGLQSTGAISDDNTVSVLTYGTCAVPGDDEDGVTFTTPLYAGMQTSIEVVANEPCDLSAWIDFNQNGSYEPGEQIFTGQSLGAGTNPLNFTVPLGAALGDTYARFRCSTDDAAESPTGMATDGEVEGYAVTIYALDLSDAQGANYPTTLAQNGARHVLSTTSSVYLGRCVDGDPDGQPTPNADGDDNDGTTSPVIGSCATVGDDEDGVRFTTLIAVGATSRVVVTASAPCILSAWMDFTGDGDWDDLGEDLFPAGQPLVAGLNNLTFAVPAGAATGPTHARFRCTTAGKVPYTGQAPDGEVEDYGGLEIVTPVDFGDLPEPPYTTTLPLGARHLLGSNVYLGTCVDAESDGQPSITAFDDDDFVNAGPFFGTCVNDDDEDGIEFDVLEIGTTDSISVTANADCTLSGWIDFNNDGDWTDPDEDLFPTGESLSAGLNVVSFPIPSGLAAGARYGRFRCTTDGKVSYIGQANDGEVEDYQILLGPAFDMGDAPAPYPTLMIPNGAAHVLGADSPYLGACVDADSNGKPTPNADGDDLAGSSTTFGVCAVPGDDEDGVSFTTPLVGGQQASFVVTVTGGCELSLWIDFNADYDWTDPGERIFDGTGPADLSAGVHTLNFQVPVGATLGDTYARFRCATQSLAGPDAQASDGEVEDYQVEIEALLDFGDAPEDGVAYPSTGVLGEFPTCMSAGGPAGWIQHGLGWAHFGQPAPAWEADADGNGGACPNCFPVYDADECFQDGDAGLLFPEPFTINAAGIVTPCQFSAGTPLGDACRNAEWGVDVDIWVTNTMPVDGYVNVLMDWTQDGKWSGSSATCDGNPIPEHVLVDFPVPQGYIGPLSGLTPPSFTVGPNSGYIWTRFSITERRVNTSDWNGEGNFEDGETEDYLLWVTLSLGDRVWYDANANGIQDEGEGESELELKNVQGITVTLYTSGDCTGGVYRTTTTNAMGYYSFTHLMSGTYCIQFSGFVPNSISPQNVGDDDTIDSDADPSTAQINDIELYSSDFDEDMGVFFIPVGGMTIPASKVALLAPRMGLATLMGLLLVGAVMARRKRMR